MKGTALQTGGVSFNQIQAKIEEGLAHHRRQDLDAAARCYEVAARLAPELPQPLHLMGMVELQRNNLQQAALWLDRALAADPNNPLILMSCGDLLRSEGRLQKALGRYLEALRIEPEHVEARCMMGDLLLQLDRPAQALEILMGAMEIDPESSAVHLQLSRVHARRDEMSKAEVHAHLCRYFSGLGDQEVPRKKIRDLYFLDAEAALQVARKGQRVRHNRAFSDPQLCYHHGDPVPGAPQTMIPLRSGIVQDHFFRTSARKPMWVQFDPSDKWQRAKALEVAARLDWVDKARAVEENRLARLSREQRPECVPGQPLRVFMPTSRLTTVMQHATNNLARALARQGCDVEVLIEQSDREIFDRLTWVRRLMAFNPHMTININTLYNHVLHPDVFNVSWWQDPMAEITAGEILPWRARDLALSPYPQYDEFLDQTGVIQRRRQDFCVDLDLFKNKTPWETRTKAVFIGTAHASFLRGTPAEKRVVEILKRKFIAGTPVGPKEHRQLSAMSGIPYLHIFDYIHPAVVRDTSIEWLCQMAPRLKRELGLDVEIYGRFWEDNPIVAPLFKGELPYGEALVEVYNQARYSFSLHPHMVRSQRLVEMAACGCVPVVYDDRANAEEPHFNDEILYFRTQRQMLDRLRIRPPGDPEEIARACSYDALARSLVEWVEESLTGNHERGE